jgi:3-hydroxy-9,10-secoandrosta-1,3,5(10)-triene-9,17-dione monooxygenase reductase component
VAKEEKLNAVYDSMRSGLFIITSAYRRKPAGCTCLWVTRVSFDPGLVAVFLAPSRHTCQTIEKGKRFVLHTLAEDCLDLARRFGLTSSRDTDKFALAQHELTRTGIPILGQAVSWLECRLASVEPQGDHHLLLGEVVNGALQREAPQMIYNPNTFYSAGEPRREEMLGSGSAH